MKVIKSSRLPRSHTDRSTCLNIAVDREMFGELKKHFLPIIQNRNFLGDYNPNIHKTLGDHFPNHPQFSLKLENGDEVTIWTQHQEVSGVFLAKTPQKEEKLE